ncbi:MAG TPA: hypothetical protein VMJ10_24730 [Kofleriaceae bacterium]|nr:hypothetical protein [Kofleriaceae bacterium]
MLIGLALVLGLGCQKKKVQEAPKRDAGPIEIDWARCEKALHDVQAAPDPARTAALLDGCPVCGDWSPLLFWATLTENGGPRRQDITGRLDTCHAYCNTDAKRRFNDTIDEARGRNSRAPWRYLGEQCREQVSAVPDPRYMSAPYFALDRIARAVTTHGGGAAAELAKIDLPLPPFSLTGAGVDLADAPQDVVPAPAVHVTLLGDGAHVGKLPRAHLGANGVTVDYGGEPYPGPVVDSAKLAAAIHALDPSPHPVVALLVPKELPADKIAAVVAAAPDVEFHLAAVAPGALPGWPVVVVARDRLK